MSSVRIRRLWRWKVRGFFQHGQEVAINRAFPTMITGIAGAAGPARWRLAGRHNREKLGQHMAVMLRGNALKEKLPCHFADPSSRQA
jgi:hypothetical protein